MGDLLNDLKRTRPPTPEVDHDRMERDLARIMALPRPQPRDWTGAPSFARRFGPVLVALAAVVLLVITVVPSDREHLGKTTTWWHVLTRNTSLMPVGDPANPYVMKLVSDTDEWFAPGQHVKVSQLSGIVGPNSPADDNKWQAAGAPKVVPIVGMNHSLRIGPMKSGAWKDENSAFDSITFDAIDKLPADVDGLRATNGTPLSPGQAMRLAIAPLSPDQRHALFALLKKRARDMGKVTLQDGRVGVGVALTATESPQFGPVEDQLIVDEQTAVPIVRRQVMTTSRYGLPAGTAVSTEEFLDLSSTDDGTSGPPTDVSVIGEVESPIIER